MCCLFLILFASLSSREPGMLNMSRKRRWFSIPGKPYGQPYGRFLRLKMPPYLRQPMKLQDQCWTLAPEAPNTPLHQAQAQTQCNI